MNFIIADNWGGVRIERDRYDDDAYVPVYETSKEAQVAADTLNDEHPGYIVGPGGALVKARPWMVYALVPVREDEEG